MPKRKEATKVIQTKPIETDRAKKSFEELKEQGRNEKKARKLQKQITKQRACSATVGDVIKLQESFQRTINEHYSLTYQTNLNLRALFELLMDGDVIKEDELGKKIKLLMEHDREASTKNLEVKKNEQGEGGNENDEAGQVDN